MVGRVIDLAVVYPAFSYENPEIDNIVSIGDDSLRECAACGKQFLPTGRNAWRMKFCTRQHYIKCAVCGKILDITPNRNIPNTCGKTCNDKYRVQRAQSTMRERYGVSNPSQVETFKQKAMSSNATHRDETLQKMRATMVSRYGAPVPMQVPELREKIAKTMVDRYGVDNPSHCAEIKDKISQINRSEEVQAKYRATSFSHYGTEYPAQSPTSPNSWENTKDKYASTMLERYGVASPFAIESCRELAKQTCLQRYGCEYASQSPEVHQRMAATRSKLQTINGWAVDSSYEQMVCNYWLGLGLQVEHNIPIEFEYAGTTHTTLIDFRVDGLLIEVKGTPYMNGVYDYKQSVPIEQKLAVYRKHHVILITDATQAHKFGHKDSMESNGLKHLDICPNPLIGVDIKLFEDSPEFPHNPKRPNCFYDVSVNGRPSQHTAFYDKRLRWEIIKNRIQYVGGFIDAKEVLVGFNVTRKAKQPSWFSKSYAKSLMEKYCTTDIVVDPFAGWGTRCDASLTLHKQYLGCDINAELVEWHKSCGRHINCQDARDFVYTGECSVFICPPYRDTEIYFDGQSNLSECEWLDIVRQNVPNAKEYIMVCHEVSEEYKPYIVETKVNSSHFNKNVEYVVLVHNMG